MSYMGLEQDEASLILDNIYMGQVLPLKDKWWLVQYLSSPSQFRDGYTSILHLMCPYCTLVYGSTMPEDIDKLNGSRISF